MSDNNLPERYNEIVIQLALHDALCEINSLCSTLGDMHPKVSIMFDIWLDTTEELVRAIQRVKHQDAARARNNKLLGRVP